MFEKWFRENNQQGSCCTKFQVVLPDKRSDFNRRGVLFSLLTTAASIFNKGLACFPREGGCFVL